MKKISSVDNVTLGLLALATAVFAYAAFIALNYANQPLLDFYSFRQTQTALSSYWLGINGFHLAYETPVGGAPWAIPFEFPIYQYLVTLLSRGFGAQLSTTGRLVSFGFLVASLFPVRATVQRLGLSRKTFLVFVALLFSSPVYLYWGRTFMIETAALFFAVASVPFFLDLLEEDLSWRAVLLFSLFSTLALLQKITTGLPLLMILGLTYAFHLIRNRASWYGILSWKTLSVLALGFAVPLLIGLAWVSFSDQVKSLNPFGVALTGKALASWNWGTTAQRMTPRLYTVLIRDRIFAKNLGDGLGFALFLGAFVFGSKQKLKGIMAVSLMAGILPVMLFFNLHIVHQYYQAANVLFLLFGASVAIGELLPQLMTKPQVAGLVTGVIVACNILNFRGECLSTTQAQFTPENSPELKVADLLKREVPDGEAFVSFGADWNSTLAFYSQRKSFAVPGWFSRYDDALSSPEKFLGGVPLGAVVVSPQEKSPPLEKVLVWAKTKGWRHVEFQDWHVFLPKSK